MIKSYVRLSSDSDIIYSGSDIQYFLIQYSFEYFTTSVRISVQIGFGYGFRYRVKCPPLSSWVELYNTNRDNVLVKKIFTLSSVHNSPENRVHHFYSMYGLNKGKHTTLLSQWKYMESKLFLSVTLPNLLSLPSFNLLSAPRVFTNHT